MPITHAAFLIAVLGIIWSLYRLHRNPDVEFNMFDLLMENGRASKVSFLVMGAFFVTSWLMIDLQESAKMTEGYLGLYGGLWVAPLIARLMNPPPTAATVKTEVTATAVTTTTPAKGKK